MRSVVATLLVLALAAACTAAPTAPAAPADDGKVQITERTAGEITALMAKRADTIAKKDLTGFQATFDGQRPALRRCQTTIFDIQTRGNVRPSAPSVAKVEPYGELYARAYVGSDANGYQRLYFRKADGAWRLSEPTESELGGEKTKSFSGLDVSYFAADDDVVDVYGKSALAVREFVLSKAQAPITAQFGLRVFPTRSAAGLQECSVAGTHIPSDKFLRIYINALFFKPGLTEMHDATTGIVKHEALHWLQNQIVPGITARMDEWMVEGWPDYIGEARGEANKKQIICNVPTPAFKQLVDGPPTDPDRPPEEGAQYYAFYNSMVEYLYVTYGAQTYFDAMVVYKDRVEPDNTYPRIFKTTPAQFYEAWKAWAKKRFAC